MFLREGAGSDTNAEKRNLSPRRWTAHGGLERDELHLEIQFGLRIHKDDNGMNDGRHLTEQGSAKAWARRL